MASSVRSLSNHYDTLQVSPTASNEQIVQAFTAQMRNARVRPDITVARLAQLSVAYETLRDPIKRRAYDDSIGIKRDPPPPPQVVGSTFFIGRATAAGMNYPDRSAATAKRPEAPVPSRADPEPRVPSFIAASLREPVTRAGPASPQAAPPPAQEHRPVPRTPVAPVREAVGESGPADEPFEIEDGRLGIGRTTATLAAGVVGVAILAFAAALPGGNPDQLPVHEAQAQAGLTVPLPPADASSESVAPDPVTTAAAAPTAETAVRSGRVARSRSKSVPSAAVDQEQAAATASDATPQSPSLDSAVAQIAADPAAAAPATAAAEPVTPAAADATLPLSSTTIARTISRIGYGCGRVVSATSMDGSGAYKITCSSGDTYRASPVRGRYHFRRLGSH